MRRRPGQILPIEQSILEAGLKLRPRGSGEFHGFMIAREIREDEAARLLTAHGTLYRALDRMEKAGLLQSRWEGAQAAATENRPRRRLYRVTAAGAEALARSHARILTAVALRRKAASA